MPLYKAWNSSRTLKKAVVATSLSDFIAKSNKKLGQNDDNDRVFIEADGTEVDEDEILLSLDPGTILIVGTSWQPADAASTAASTTKVDEETPINTTHASENNVANADLNPTETKEADLPQTSTMESPKSFGIFSNLKYPNAKMKGLKTYTETEIREARSELERRRRQFWNDKAEQLCKKGDTRKLDKTTLYGVIDVSWTLRKTAMLETDANAVIHDEQVLFAEKEIASGRKLGSQKKDTTPKNLERVRLSHNQVELLNEELEKIKRKFNSAATTAKERGEIQKEYKPKMVLFDGAYSELKRAQEALTKSIKQKRSEMEKELRKIAEPEEKKKKLS